MISKMEKAKKGNKKQNAKVAEKPEKVIKKVESEMPKAKKNNQKLDKIKKAVKAELVETKASVKNKKDKKQPKKEVVEESSEAESEIEDVESPVKEEEVASEEADDAEEAEDDDVEMEEDDEDEDDEDENEAQDDEEEAESEEADSDDDAPVEVPVIKKIKAEPKVKTEKQSTAEEDEEDSDVAFGHTLLIRNLPSRVRRSELAKIFEPFGKVLSIIFRSPENLIFFRRSRLTSYSAYVILDTADATTKAMASLNGTTLNNKILAITNPEMIEHINPSNTVHVRNLSSSTTTENLKKVFSKCGEIKVINLMPKHGSCAANISFKNSESIPSALQLNGTSVDDQKIEVTNYKANSSKEQINAGNRTVFVKNLKTSTTEETLRETFSSCGEVESVHIKPTSMGVNFAFVCFKAQTSVGDALKVSGQEVDGQEINVYNYNNKKHPKYKKGNFKPKGGQKQNQKPTGKPNKNKGGKNSEFRGVNKKSQAIKKSPKKAVIKQE